MQIMQDATAQRQRRGDGRWARPKNQKYNVSGFSTKQIPGEENRFVLFPGLGGFLEGAGKGRCTVFVWIHPSDIQVGISRRHLGMGLALTAKFEAGDMNLGIIAIQMYLRTEWRQTRARTESEAVTERSNKGWDGGSRENKGVLLSKRRNMRRDAKIGQHQRRGGWVRQHTVQPHGNQRP